MYFEQQLSFASRQKPCFAVEFETLFTLEAKISSISSKLTQKMPDDSAFSYLSLLVKKRYFSSGEI